MGKISNVWKKKPHHLSTTIEKEIKILSPFILNEYSNHKESLELKIKRFYEYRKRCADCGSFLTKINNNFVCLKCKQRGRGRVEL